MKKLALSLLVTSGLAAAYTGGSWTLGKKIETQMQNFKFANPCYENVKITSTAYKRNLFSSTQELTISYDDPKLSRFNPNGEPFQFKLKNKIVHGPIPGVLGVGAARIDSEIVMDEASKTELKKLFGEKQALQIRTLVSYDQGGTITISSPAAKATIKGDAEVDWKGFNTDIRFENNLAHYKVNGQFNGMTIADTNKKGSITIGTIQFDSNQTQAAPNSCVYMGPTSAKIDTISFDEKKSNTQFSIEKFETSSNSVEKAELLKLDAKFNIAKFRFNQGDISDIQFAMSFNQIHRPSLDSFIKVVQQMSAPDADSIEQQKQMKQLLTTLLQKQPDMSLDRLSFKSKAGETKLVGQLKLSEISTDEINSGLLDMGLLGLLKKIEASSELSFPEAMLADMVNFVEKDPNRGITILSGWTNQLAMFEQMGHLKRDKNILKAKFEFKQGTPLINGNPMGGNPASENSVENAPSTVN
jgi:uncharacterized protein YdgA (DUF945 family)